MTSGILILKKPSGPSSSGVLGPVKRALKTRKVGHSGTLDPFASGVMIVLVGTATRTARWFTGLDKEYRGIVQFGSQTDTLDREGVVVSQAPLPDALTVTAVLPSFIGAIQQIPPAYSALKIQGRRAYEIARAGGTPQVPTRTVTIHSLSMNPLDDAPQGRWQLSVTCGSGTYVRALARDIAAAAGTVGYLQELERRSVGPFLLDQAVSLEELQDDPDPLQLIHPVGPALRSLGIFDELIVQGDRLRAVQTGRPLSGVLPEPEAEGRDTLVLDPAGTVYAVLRFAEGRWRYEVVLKPLEHNGDAPPPLG